MKFNFHEIIRMNHNLLYIQGEPELLLQKNMVDIGY